MSTKYKVWSEWDIGLGNTVYPTKERALQVADEALRDCQMYDEGETFQGYLDEGLVGVEEIEVIEPRKVQVGWVCVNGEGAPIPRVYTTKGPATAAKTKAEKRYGYLPRYQNLKVLPAFVVIEE